MRNGNSAVALTHPGDDLTHRADHLIDLPGGEWALWRWSALRGAGFPAAHALALSVKECSALADRLLDAQQDTETAWERAVAVLRQEIVFSGDEDRRELRKALKQLKKGKAPAQKISNPEMATAINTFSKHLGQAVDLGRAFRESFEADVISLSETVSSIVSNNRFREAVTWQNRSALIIGLDKLLTGRASSSQGRMKETRRSEVRAASYWQRYCMKNDTIGFFGPVGWAKWVPQGEAMIAKPGPDLIARRNVYFEGWCIDALAEAIAQDETIRPWIAPRRMPHGWIEGMAVWRPNESVVNLSPKEMAIIRVCDGRRAAKDIARHLATSTSLFDGEEDVYRLLDELDSSKLISWHFEVPWDLQIPHEWHIESNLRRKLAAVGDEVVRGRALRLLNELDNARIEVARAAGNAERLNQAMQEMEAIFTRLTKAAATRRPGKMYSGRTLVYEDCRRDIEVGLGPSLLTELGAPLSLVLASARWFISRVSASCLDAFRSIYAALSKKAGSPVVDFSSFWLKAQPLVFGNRKLLYGNILEALQQKWSHILSIPSGQKRVSYNSEQLRSPVLDAFDVPYSGWQYARYNSPDIMIAASSQEAIQQRQYLLVLGEFHVATNNLANKLFLSQHPSPQEIISALDRDLPEPRIVPVPDKQNYTSRDHTLVTTGKDFRLEYSHDISAIPGEQSLPIAALVVEDTAQGLVVKTRDDRLRFDLIEAFADLLSERVSNHFEILPADDHVPRISFDRLVIHRETWRFPPSALAFAREKDEAFRFLEARRWARSHAIPRFVFVKSPAEEKPFYVDFDSPVLINLLARVIGQCSELTMAGSVEPALVVTEMLPTPDQLWLPDAQDNRYTSEFRIVAVDLARNRKANV